MCEQGVLNCFFMVYPVQAILGTIGLILCIIGVIIYSVRGNTRIDIWIFKNIPVPKFSKALGAVFLSIGLLCVSIGLIWLAISNRGRTLSDALTPTAQVEGISLIGLRYMADGWDPHLVDLRTAAVDGIPARQGGSLQLSSFWISVPAELSDSEVQVEIYASGDLIGTSYVQKLVPPVTRIDDIQIKGYQDASNSDAWLVQSGWENLDISLIIYDQGEAVGSSKSSIRINPDGMSWLTSPPNASLVSISYTINDGAVKVLDLRQGLDGGLNVTQNDSLKIQSISYKSNADGAGQRLWVEAYLTTDGYQSDTLKTNRNDLDIIQRGFHDLSNISPLSWAVPPDMNWLIMTLERSDRTVLDRINIPLNATGDPGLVSVSDSVLWPFEQVKYIDFENPSDFEAWSGFRQNILAPSNAQHFSGEHALAITVVSDETQEFVKRERPFRAESIVGQVYWPKQDGVSVEWSQICFTPSFRCAAVPYEVGYWNTFVVDLSELEYNGEKLDRVELSSFFIQGKVIGASGDKPYTFYMDGIQIYPVTTP